MPDEKARLVMLASEMRILGDVPEGTFDRVKLAVPPEVWENRSLARRWLLSGGTAPVNQRKPRLPRTPQDPARLTARQRKALERQAKEAARDFVGDRMSDNGGTWDPDDDVGSYAVDLADAVLFDLPPEARERHRGWVADVVNDEMLEMIGRKEGKR